MQMKKFFKSIYKFFLKIYIFESYARFVRLKKSTATSFFIKSEKEVNINKPKKKYFEKDKYKLIRFKKNSKFMGLKLKNEIEHILCHHRSILRLARLVLSKIDKNSS